MINVIVNINQQMKRTKQNKTKQNKNPKKTTKKVLQMDPTLKRQYFFQQYSLALLSRHCPVKCVF